MDVILTPEQEQLRKEVVKWYKNFPYGKPYYYYSGAAGTGKTTVARAIIDELGLKNDEYIACAYVGKAVLVLLRTGLPATTIHSLIYVPRTETVFETQFDEFGNPHRVKRHKTGFMLKNNLPRSIKLIIEDEGGMVNDQMQRDLQSFGIPILMMGDQNQLPPVFGKNSIMDNPDFVLHQIMRQEEGNPIVHLSQCILNGTPIDYGTYGNSHVVSSFDLNHSLLTDYDAILCVRNKTREYLNDSIRYEILGYDDRIPREGDKVICRKNNWDEELDGIYLTNGLVGNLTNINKSSLHRDILYASFTPDFMDESFDKLTLDYKYMKSPWDVRKGYSNMMDRSRPKKNLFEYGYAITVHLSQGSEYSRVLFIDEEYRDHVKKRKLQYTAVTRAKDSIVWVKEPDKKPNTFYYNGTYYDLSDTTTRNL